MYVQPNNNIFPLQRRNTRAGKRSKARLRLETDSRESRKTDDRSDAGAVAPRGQPAVSYISTLCSSHPPPYPRLPHPPLRDRRSNGSKPSHPHLHSCPGRQCPPPFTIEVNERSRSAARCSGFRGGDVFVQERVVRHRFGRVWRKCASVLTHPISLVPATY
jgi:hypothetical protein